MPCALAVRCDLLDVFQAQQHLVFRQRLCPSAKPMPLQFLDDLMQPLALAPLGEQHRFQRLRIVRQDVAHSQIRAYSPPSGDASEGPDSLRRSAANNYPGCAGAGVPPCLVHKPPVESFQQRRRLRCRQAHHAVVDLRPAEIPLSALRTAFALSVSTGAGTSASTTTAGTNCTSSASE